MTPQLWRTSSLRQRSHSLPLLAAVTNDYLVIQLLQGLVVLGPPIQFFQFWFFLFVFILLLYKPIDRNFFQRSLKRAEKRVQREDKTTQEQPGLWCPLSLCLSSQAEHRRCKATCGSRFVLCQKSSGFQDTRQPRSPPGARADMQQHQ